MVLGIDEALLLGLLVSSSSCGAGWHRIDAEGPGAFPRGQQIEVWQGSKRIQLHAVELRGDSITGVRLQDRATCRGCRISLPSATVDSIRTGNPTAGLLKSVALTLGTWLTIGLSAYALNRD